MSNIFRSKNGVPTATFWVFQKPKKNRPREIHHLWTKPHLILATYPNKHIWLVVLTILKHMKVNGKDDIAYIMENKTCLKPPTSHDIQTNLPKPSQNYATGCASAPSPGCPCGALRRRAGCPVGKDHLGGAANGDINILHNIYIIYM